MSLDKKIYELDKDSADKIQNELTEQCSLTFYHSLDAGWKLTQHNFLVNAGGSTALLAILNKNESVKYLIIVLVIFILGTLAAIIETWSLKNVLDNLNKNARER